MRLRRAEAWLVFAAALAVYATVSVHVLDHNYLNSEALHRWSKVLSTMGASGYRLENFGLVYPTVPIYALIPFYAVGFLRSPMAAYLLGNIIAAVLLAVTYHRLRDMGYSRRLTLPLVLLVAINPLFVWTASNGSDQAMSLLMFYLLVRAIVHLQQDGGARAHMVVGFALAAYFFVDARSIYIAAALLPCFAFIADREMLRRSPLSVYTVIYAPLVFGVLSWSFLNWLFWEDALHFVRDPGSAFIGAAPFAQHVDFLQRYGDRFWASLSLMALMTAIAFPAYLALVDKSARGQYQRTAMFVPLVAVLVAAALSADALFLVHPANMLFLLTAPLLFGVTLFKMVPGRYALLVGLLFVGNVGGLMVMQWRTTPELRQWSIAMMGRQQDVPHRPELALGVWSRDKSGILIDDREAYPAVVARGSGRGVYAPFSPEFKAAMLTGYLDVPMVAVPRPGGPVGAFNQINQRFPTLYEAGYPGYRVVYDSLDWRVYQRVARRAPLVGS